MGPVLGAFDTLLAALRPAIFVVGVGAAVVAALDWATKTGRMPPFSPLARFSRRTLRPLLAPVERTIVRAGGTPSQASWWFLAFVVLGGIALLSLLDFVRQQLVVTVALGSAGARGWWVLAVRWTAGALQIALAVRVVTSWIGGSRTPVGRLAARMTDWLLRPIQRVVPPLGGVVDLSPILAYVAIALVAGVLAR